LQRRYEKCVFDHLVFLSEVDLALFLLIRLS
jgi:hypothetical protein